MAQGFVLAKTTFSTGVDEKLKVVDAYAQQSSLVKNNDTPDVLDKIDLDKYLGLKGQIGDGLQIIKASTPIGLKVDADSLVKSLVAANSGLQGTLATMSSSVKAGLTATSGQLSNVTATINGIKSIVNKADIGTLKGLSSMVSTISGANFPITFTDKTGLTILSANLIKVSASLGIPDALKAFTDNIADKGILAGIGRSVMPYIVSSSDVNMLSNLASSSLAKDVLKIKPDFIHQFAANYKLPEGTPHKDYNRITDSITSSFYTLNNDWDKFKTSTGRVLFNSSVVNAGSEDLKRLLKAKANINHIPIEYDAIPDEVDTSVNMTALSKVSAMQDFYTSERADKKTSGEPLVMSVSAADAVAAQFPSSKIKLGLLPNGSKVNLAADNSQANPSLYNLW